MRRLGHLAVGRHLLECVQALAVLVSTDTHRANCVHEMHCGGRGEKY